METPARRQYLQLKRRYPDAILFYRLGDFYEMFDADAELAARELDIVLTSREFGPGQRTPMCGVPYHAVEGYIAKLIAKGYKVAICEQLSEPGRGLVERDVVRVVTPGTVVEPGLLEAARNNYLVALYAGQHGWGLACADVSTGEFAVTELTGERADTLLAQELDRLAPAEVLAVEAQEEMVRAALAMPGAGARHLTLRPAQYFSLARAEERLKEQFQVTSLEGYGCAGLPLAVSAAGALVAYLQETNLAALRLLDGLRTYSASGFMTLDAATRRNLEIFQSSRTGQVKGSLLWVLDRTRTPMGGRLLRAWLAQPLLDVAALRRRQDAVAELLQDTLRRERLMQALGQVADLERLAGRVRQSIALPRELLQLRASLLAVAGLRDLLRDARCEELVRLARALDPCEAVCDLIGRAIADDAPARLTNSYYDPQLAPRTHAKGSARRPRAGTLLDGTEEVAAAAKTARAVEYATGIIRPGFAPELDALVESARQAREYIAGLEATERERTGVRGLKVGYNKVFGYYLEVSRAALNAPLNEEQRARLDGFRGAMPQTVEEYLERRWGYVRKQTLVGAERFITQEMKEYEAIVLSAQERQAALEREIYHRVRAEVAEHAPAMLATAAAVAHLDVYTSLAEVAARNRYVRPELDEGDTISVTAGRHPVVELTLEGERFVPNDCYLSNRDAQVLILTGPNMSGKSTFCRMVAVIVLMAQIGSFVPADAAHIGLVDHIFTRIGAQDDLAAGASTFLVEMQETANILANATPRSLVVLDEVGRGTSTYDGMAIARAVVEHLHNAPHLGCKTLFATHYHELTELEKLLPRVKNFRVDVLEEGDRVVFLHKVVPGGADRSYGIHVARLAGLPRAVVRRAQELLSELERGDGLISARRLRERRTRAEAPGYAMLPLFAPSHPLVDELAALDVDAMTPLEAITKLYELRRKARGT